jgi:hypothetical protein
MTGNMLLRSFDVKEIIGSNKLTPYNIINFFQKELAQILLEENL